MKNINEQLKKGRLLKMNPDERGLIRAALLHRLGESVTPKTNYSPYVKNILITMKNRVISPFSFHSFVKVTAIALIILIGGGSSLSFASEKALPGEALYGFKVSVSEPVREALAFSKEDRASIQAKRIITRVDEIKALKEKGTLTEEKSAIVKNLIEKQSVSFIETAIKLNEEGYNNSVVETTSVLLSVLDDYSYEAQNNLAKIMVEDEYTIENNTKEPEQTSQIISSETISITQEDTITKDESITRELETENEENKTNTDISTVIMSVAKSIETKLPEVVDTIKDKKLEDQKQADISESKPVSTKIKCPTNDSVITDTTKQKIDTLIKRNNIDTSVLKLASFSEKDGISTINYTNVIEGITIYDNTVSYIFNDGILTNTIGNIIIKKPFDETAIKVSPEEAMKIANTVSETTECSTVTLMAKKDKNVFGKTTFTPIWMITTSNLPVFVNANTKDIIKIPTETPLR